MAKSLRIAAFASVALCMTASFASAAPLLMSSIPAANSSGQAPKSIRLNFNESVDARQTTVAVTDAAGKALGTGKISNNSTNSKQLIVPIEGGVPAGKYSVSWHTVGSRADKGEGMLAFEVKQ